MATKTSTTSKKATARREAGGSTPSPQFTAPPRYSRLLKRCSACRLDRPVRKRPNLEEYLCEDCDSARRRGYSSQLDAPYEPDTPCLDVPLEYLTESCYH